MLVFGECKDCNVKSSAVKNLYLKELLNLENNCITVNFKKGASIFKQGMFTTNIVYLRKGLVKIHFDEESGEQIIKMVQAPAFIGIPAIINKKVNQYSATSVTQTSTCIINSDTFLKFIDENGKFAYEIIAELCKNELDLFRKYISRTKKQIQGRLAETILFFSNEIFYSDVFILPLTRAELGNYIHATRESVSRVLNDFVTSEIIKLSGKKISILNRELLETFAISN